MHQITRWQLTCILSVGFFIHSYSQERPYPHPKELLNRISEAPNDSAKISGYIHLSNAYLGYNLLDSSKWAAEQAKILAVQSQLPVLEGWADFLRGAYYFYEGYYDKGIQIEQAVVDRAEQFGEPLLRANAQKLIGWMYTEMGKEQEALTLFMEALPVFKKYRNQDLQMNVGIGYYGLATTYFYLEQFDLALLYYDSAISAQPPMDPRETALALADRAAVLVNYKKDIEAARKNALRANDLLQDLPLQRDAQAYVQAELARIYATEGKLELANQWALSAYRIYNQLPLVKRYVSVYSTLSEAFYIAGNFKYAYLSEWEARVLNDSIYNWRKLQVIEELEAKYEDNKKNEAIAQLKLESLSQKNVIIKNQTFLILLGSFSAVLAVLGLIYYRNREKYHRKIKMLETTQKVREEKDRIARDLHDNIGAQLTTLGLGLNRLQRQPDASLTETLQDNVNSIVNELRETIWAIERDKVSLAEVRDKMANWLWRLGQADPETNFSLAAEEQVLDYTINPVTALAMFRIFQEAVHNAVRHGKAQLVVVQMFKTNGQLVLIINDNGKGFEFKEDKILNGHMGIANMKKRSLEIKAVLQIHSRPGEGTTIKLELDLI